MLDKITNDLALVFCIILTASCLLILHNKKRRYFIAYAISLLFIAAYQINSIVFKAEYPAYTISIVLYCISLAFFSIATLMHNKLPHSTLGIATVCLLFFAIIYANNLNFIAVIFTSFFFHLGYILCHLKSRSI